MNSFQIKKILSCYTNISFLTKLHIYIRLQRSYFEEVERYIPKKGQILDFGCGHGFFSLYLSESQNRIITGVDISKKKIEAANKAKHGENIHFIYSPEPIKLLEKRLYYDGIAILNVLYLISVENQLEIIAKAKQSLKPKGKLLIMEHDAHKKIRTLYTKLREYIMVKILHLTYGKTLTYNDHAWWKKTLKEHFRNVEPIPIDRWKHQYLYICSN